MLFKGDMLALPLNEYYYYYPFMTTMLRSPVTLFGFEASNGIMFDVICESDSSLCVAMSV